jgi:predicted DNA repair protein MutK
MSEGALICTAAAVAAAIRDATGVVIRDLPLTPERVWKALSERPLATAAAHEVAQRRVPG